MCASAAYVRTHRTVLLPAWVIVPWCIIPAKFLTDGASPMYATSLSGSGNLLISSISYAMASPVNLPTPGINMRICAYSLSSTMLFILKSTPAVYALINGVDAFQILLYPPIIQAVQRSDKCGYKRESVNLD